jgi:hypothetical protein
MEMTAKILTQERLKELLHYDPDTGDFTWKISPRYGINIGCMAGCNFLSNGKRYSSVMIKGNRYSLHRLAWLYVYGAEPLETVDHINGDGTDNRISNLRDVSLAENQKNKRQYKNCTSGCTGVIWVKKKSTWHATICINSKRISLRYHRNWWDAVCARKSAEYKYNFHINHGNRSV